MIKNMLIGILVIGYFAASYFGGDPEVERQLQLASSTTQTALK